MKGVGVALLVALLSLLLLKNKTTPISETGVSPLANAKLLPASYRKPLSQLDWLKDLDLDQYLNKEGPTLINFWAHWCSPCLAELPHLIDLASSSQHSFQLILINVDTTAPSILQAKEWSHQLNNKAPWVWANDLFLKEDPLPFSQIPYHILLDPQQRIASEFGGSVTSSSQKLMQLVSQLKK